MLALSASARTAAANGRLVVQLIVVVALAIFALGILIPGIFTARSRDNGRGYVSIRLKQLALSLHNFESGFGRLPPAIGGTPTVGAGVVVENPKGLEGAYSP